GHLRPLQPFGEDEQTLVRHLDHFVDGRQCADVIQIGRLGIIHPGLALRDHQYGLFFAERINELNRTFPSYPDGQAPVAKRYRIPHRQYWDVIAFRFARLLPCWRYKYGLLTCFRSHNKSLLTLKFDKNTLTLDDRIHDKDAATALYPGNADSIRYFSPTAI